MKLIELSEDVDVLGLIVSSTGTDIQVFIQHFNLTKTESHPKLHTALRKMGVKRMRFDKNEERLLGEFSKAEIFSDGIFEYCLLYFEKGVAMLACEEATKSCIVGQLRDFGLDEERFGADPELYLKMLGYSEVEGDFTFKDSGAKASLKALHGKPLSIHKYQLADDYLFIVVFHSNTLVQFKDEEQMIRIFHDLGVFFSERTLERQVGLKLGSRRTGQFQLWLGNDQVINSVIDRDSDGWASSLLKTCRSLGGGIKAIKLDKQRL